MKRNIIYSLLGIFFIISFASCGSDDPATPDVSEDTDTADTSSTTTPTAVVAEPADFDGTKRAGTTYQLLVYSFADSDGDGIGDFDGITEKLDYLDSLGVTAIWLSPIHPASSYHGYDVTDYYSVNPTFGTEEDLEDLITAAHSKDIDIYLDYVLNHSSAKNTLWYSDDTVETWFTKACSSTDSEYRDYYTFSNDPASDIAAGKIPMIATEGASGYDEGQWFTVSGGVGATGRYKFDLDWSDSSAPTVTVTSTEEDTNVPTSGERYLYYGDDICVPFNKTGSSEYTVTVDFDSDWGFLIRTSNTSWSAGTKYGAQSSSPVVTLGSPFTLYVSTSSFDPADIVFSQPTYYHSHLWTSWFADFNYGYATEASSSPAFKDLAESADKWIGMGIDGMRLDAVKHIYHNASSDENPTFLAQWYEHCDSAYKALGNTDDFFMVGEVFSEASAVAPYYKGLPSCFEFSFWWRLKDVLTSQSAYTFPSQILKYESLYKAYRSNPIESTKLSNHDEDRTGSDLSKSLQKEKQAAAFLLTAPGKPFIYQGEELGYYGTKTNGDEYVRTPIMWDKAGTQVASGALNGKVDNSMLTQSISVEAQNSNSASLLSVYKKLSRLRNTYPALASGTMSEHGTYNSSNSTYKTIACWYMTSTDGSQKLLVVHNVATTGTQSLTFEDDLSKPIAVIGSATSAKNADGTYTLNMSSNTSVVFQIK
jgi:alpha-amylase